LAKPEYRLGFFETTGLAGAAGMILCDTNILIEFYKNNPAVVQELRTIGQDSIAISIITQAELYYGAVNKQELLSIRRHLSLIHRYPLDLAASLKFIDLMETFSLSHKLSIPDALIAATALVHDVAIYTFNRRDFHFIPGIHLHEPKTY
jgi:tRNA(fMet)-specific endonuclease VapC